MTTPPPGRTWRLLAHRADGPALDVRFDRKAGVQFDELVVDDWFHIEQMSTRCYWMRVGPIDLNVIVPRLGDPHVSVVLGDGDAGTADLHHAARVDPYLPRDASLLTARRLRALLAALEEAPDAS